MDKISKNETAFTAVEGLLMVLIVAVIGFGGYYVWHTQHKTKPTAATLATSSTKPTTSTKNITSISTQKYITISAWGVRVPYSGSDTLSVANQTCAENGDSKGDTVNIGCQVDVNSQDLANTVGSCQSTKATGTVGYFYRMGVNDNYNETSGAGFESVAQWVAANPGQYTQIGNYTYAFAEIGAAWGGQGAVSINTSTHALADTVPAGCSNWVAEYNRVEPSVAALASKFEATK